MTMPGDYGWKPYPIRRISYAAWLEEGTKLFGPDGKKWRFVCPACRHSASWLDWRKAGAPEAAVAFSCIGRWIKGSRGYLDVTKKGPCDYAGGGDHKINPVIVFNEDEDDETTVFEFDRASSSPSAT